MSQLVDDHGLCTGSDATDVGFLVCDGTEAWVVEVSGKQWVAERVTSMIQRAVVLSVVCQSVCLSRLSQFSCFVCCFTCVWCHTAKL